MITVKQAKQLIQKNVPQPLRKIVSLKEALGLVLAKDISSPFPLPLYDNSAMDGFVLNSKNTLTATKLAPIKLKLGLPIKAGDTKRRMLDKFSATPIMTGAVIPGGADTVLMKEYAEIKEGYLIFKAPYKNNRHIRYRGEEVEKGEVLLSKNEVIHSGTMGVLASIGKGQVPIFKAPQISLMATGTELVSPGKPLRFGKIYDSNSTMIRSALNQMGIHSVDVTRSSDRLELLNQRVKQALNQSDMLILMGGVSVGDYDFVKDVLNHLGVKTIFWKVSQKPGKPIYFGKKGKKLIFGLPGNPASVFTCFYEYVYPAIRQWMGFSKTELPKKKLSLGTEVKGDPFKTIFLKGRIVENKVQLLSKQGSHMLSSLADAHCFIVLPPRQRVYKKNEIVEVHQFFSDERGVLL